MEKQTPMTGLGLLAIVLLIVACGVEYPAGRTPVVGSGAVVVTKHTLGAINEVELAGPGALVVKQGAADTLTIEAEDNILPYLKVELDGRRLVLRQADRSGPLRPTRPIAFQLTVRELTGLDLSGSGAVEATGITTDRLSVQVSGSGSMRIANLKADVFGALLNGSGSLTGSGKVHQETVFLHGSGQFNGDGLQASDASVSLTGSGNAAVRVTNHLSLQVVGSGDVTYSGNPTVTRQAGGRGGYVRSE